MKKIIMYQPAKLASSLLLYLLYLLVDTEVILLQLSKYLRWISVKVGLREH